MQVQATRLIPQERSQQRILEELVVILVPPIQQQSVEVFKMIPQERVSERVVEQILPVPRTQEHVVEASAILAQAISARTRR